MNDIKIPDGDMPKLEYEYPKHTKKRTYNTRPTNKEINPIEQLLKTRLNNHHFTIYNRICHNIIGYSPFKMYEDMTSKYHKDRIEPLNQDIINLFGDILDIYLNMDDITVNTVIKLKQIKKDLGLELRV